MEARRRERAPRPGVPAALVAGCLCATVIAAAPAGGRRVFALQPVEIEGTRLTLPELIERAAREVEEQKKVDPPRRYTQHVRVVLRWKSGRRTSYEEIARIEAGLGGPERRMLLLQREEEWTGDSVRVKRQDEKARRGYVRWVGSLRDFPLALRSGDYRLRILERRPLGDRALLHIAYEPKEEFAPCPEGDAWLDTKDYVLLRQTGSLKRNVPMPMFLREVEYFRLIQARAGPLWIDREFAAGVLMRGPGMPERVDVLVRNSGVELLDPAVAPAAGAMTAGAQRELALLDSLAAVDRGSVDALILQPPATDLERIGIRGDSLLGAWSRRPSLRVSRLRPVLRYDRVERLFLGAKADLAGPGPLRSLRFGSGYAFGRKRASGLAAIDLERTLAGTVWHGGLRLEGRDGVQSFGAQAMFLQPAITLTGGDDPQDYYGVREVRITPWVCRAPLLGLVLGAHMVARAAEHEALESGSLWTLARGRIAARPQVPVDPGRVRAWGLGVALGSASVPGDAEGLRPPPLQIAGEWSGRALGGDLPYRMLCARLRLRPLLPGGRRLVIRGDLLIGSSRLPRQMQMYLGGDGSLRAYPGRTLAGWAAYHLGGELYLNRDILGWLPGISDRALGLEAFLAADQGGVFHGTGAGGADARGGPSRTSVGLGCSEVLGIAWMPRLSLSVHAGIGRGDRACGVRLTAG